jgi:hypothetical protein
MDSLIFYSEEDGQPIDWFAKTVRVGLAFLLGLRLKGCPSEDMVILTRESWMVSLEATPIAWQQELDEARLAKAFKALCGMVREWPAPIDLIEILPLFPRPEIPQARLEYRAATPERLKEQLSVINAEKQRRSSLGLPEMSNKEKILLLAEHRARQTGEPLQHLQEKLKKKLKAFQESQMQ